MSLYLHEFEIILEMRFQALRLAALISVSRYLHDFGHLGDMRSSFQGILFKKPSWSTLGNIENGSSSFEARNLKRASRSYAKTGL